MRTRPVVCWWVPCLAALALSLALPRPVCAGEGDAEPPAEKEGEKPKEQPKAPFQIRAHKEGAHVVGIHVREEVAVGDRFEVRRGSRLVGYAEVTELVEYWPKLAYLIGSGRPDDDLFPLAPPVPFVELLTDDRTAPETKELKALLADRLLIEDLGEDEKIVLHKQCTVRIVIQHGGVLFMGGDPIAQPFARGGGTVILDTLAYSHIKGEIADETKFKEPATLRIVREEGFTAGFPAESRVPWYGSRKAKQFVARYIKGLPQQDASEKLLATDDSGKNSALLDADLGGHMAVMDLLSPTGRAGRDPGAKNKLVFVARVCGAGPSYARYLPSKPEYDDLMKWFDDLVDSHKEKMSKAFEGGAEKKENFVYSYTIGDKEKPLVVLAGALDGTAWLGSTSLQRLAEILLDNPEHDPKIDWLLERLRVKILPVLNPHGYRTNAARDENQADLDRNFAYHWEEFADKKARGKQPFSEAGSAIVQSCIEKEKAIAFLDIGVDDYDAGYRVVRARDGTEAQQGLFHGLVAIVNARLKYRFVVGDKMLQLRVTRDAERPSAANWAGSKGALAASLRICGDGEDSLANQEAAIQTCLHFLYATALSREKPEPAPAPKEPPKKPARPVSKGTKTGAK